MKFKRSFISPQGTLNTAYLQYNQDARRWTAVLVDWDMKEMAVLGIAGAVHVAIFAAHVDRFLATERYDPAQDSWVRET